MDQDNSLNLKLSIADDTLVQCPKCKAFFERTISFCTADGTRLEGAVSAGPVASLFAGKYEILEEIGRGGMGTVYRVRQTLLDRIFALKVIPKEMLNDLLITRFQREAKTMASLDHPNLGRILDFGIYQNQPFMVMEFVDGTPLNKLVSQAQLSIEELIDVFCQVLDALAHAHKKGVLHRDIKPSNIMIMNTGRADSPRKAVLLDFGIAKRFDTANGAEPDNIKTQALTRTGEMIGSPLYMSPEHSRGDPLSERSDLYSIGCSLFECLTGTAPFVGKSTVDTLILHMEKPAPTLKEASLGRDYPGGLERAIRKLLSKNPDDRYQTAEETKRALSLAIKLDDKQADDKSQDDSAKTISRATIALVCVAVLILFSVIAFLTMQGDTAARSNKAVIQEDKIALEKTWMTVVGQAVFTGKPEDESNSDSEDDNRKINLRAGAVTEIPYIQLTGKEEALALRQQTLEESRVKLIQQNPNLTRLGLAEAKFPHSMLGNLAGNLKVLRLTDAEITDDDMKYVAKNSSVERLMLNANPITSNGLSLLAPLRSLQMLELGGTDCDVRGLSKLHNSPRLTQLFLNNNDLIDDRAALEVSSMPSLQRLNLNKTKVTSKGIGYLTKLRNLFHLSLGNLKLQDRDLSTLSKNQNLAFLHLSHNKITARGLKSLLPLTHLTHLELDANPIDDTAVDTILQMKKLRHLNLSGTKMTPAGLKKLTTLPELKEIYIRKIPGIDEAFAHDFMTQCKTCQQVVFLAERDSGYRRSEWKLDEQNKPKDGRQSVE